MSQDRVLPPQLKNIADGEKKRSFACRGFESRNACKGASSNGRIPLRVCQFRHGQAIQHVEKTVKQYDRLLVFTDEQSHDRVSEPKRRSYLINVASNHNGVGYGAWTHIDGWSEAVITYIQELERFDSS